MKLSQKREEVDKRHEQMFEMYQQGMSYTAIGNHFGQHRATVTHAVRKVTDMRIIYGKLL
jgi:transposase